MVAIAHADSIHHLGGVPTVYDLYYINTTSTRLRHCKVTPQSTHHTHTTGESEKHQPISRYTYTCMQTTYEFLRLSQSTSAHTTRCVCVFAWARPRHHLACDSGESLPQHISYARVCTNFPLPVPNRAKPCQAPHHTVPRRATRCHAVPRRAKPYQAVTPSL